jgi:thiol-disulfide isomerase/thioredoxin
MKKVHVLLLLFCSSLTTLSGQITLQGKIRNVPSSAVQVGLVEYWAVDHWQQLAILQLENGGAFIARISSPAQAQCRIRLVSQMKVWSDFILPGPQESRDTTLVFDLDYKTMNGGPAIISGSAENSLYAQLMSAYHNLNLLSDSAAATPIAQLQAANRAFNLQCRDMAQQHPRSFTGDIVANLLLQPGKEDFPKDAKIAAMAERDFLAAHALDKTPFRYEGILYHSAFQKVLKRYQTYCNPGKQFIDGVMARRNGSEAVDLFLFKYLLDMMLEQKDESGLKHLLTWYLPDCSDESPLPDNTKTMVLALQNCEPGKIMPDQQMPDPAGNSVSFSAVCAKNKMTLLFFWRNNCAHCQEFKPVLTALYEKYHLQGLEVLAISLDKTDIGWKETLQRAPTSWVNVFVPHDRRQEINRLFPIPSTPTLIALDSQRKVLSRLVLRNQLESYLRETLPKL